MITKNNRGQDLFHIFLLVSLVDTFMYHRVGEYTGIRNGKINRNRKMGCKGPLILSIFSFCMFLDTGSNNCSRERHFGFIFC